MHARMPDDHRQDDANRVDEARVIAAALLDPAAFAPLYQRYASDIYGFCYLRLGVRDVADDLTARIFIRAIERLHQYRPRPGATFRSWLFSIARNMLTDEWRRRSEIRLLPEQIDFTRDDGPGPEDVVVHRSEMERLRAALASLPERQQDVIELRMVGFTTAEIADALGISVAAVKSAQTRAYRALKHELSASKGADL